MTKLSTKSLQTPTFSEPLRDTDRRAFSMRINPRLLDFTLIASLVLFYVWNVYRHFWSLPCPSDPLQYLGPTVWKSTYAYWPWLDRLMLAINLRIATLGPAKPYIAGMVYIGFVNAATIAIGCLWSYRRGGIAAAVVTGVLLNTSYLFLGFATYIYPDQTVAMFSMLAFVAFFSAEGSAKQARWIILAGVLAAFAAWTKITGISIVGFLGGYLLWHRRWKDALQFSFAVVLGSGLVVGLFCLLYNVESFKNILYLFTKSNSFTGGGYSNVVAYLHVLIAPRYLPVYIGLFITMSGYRDRDVGPMYGAALSFVVFIYAVYAITRRGGEPIPTYIYATFPFAATGLGIHMGKIFAQSTSAVRNKSRFFLIACMAMAFMYIGLRQGIKHSPVAVFDMAHNYYRPADIFSPAHGLTIPWTMELLYMFGPVIVIVSLCVAELTRRKSAVVIFLLSVSLWGAAANGGIAYQKTLYEREWTDIYYSASNVIKQVKQKSFAVYVKSWNEAKDFRIERVLWVYRLFYDNKHERPTTYDGQYLHDLEITRNIKLVGTEEELAKIISKYLLTDSPASALRHFPDAAIAESFVCDERRYYVFRVGPADESDVSTPPNIQPVWTMQLTTERTGEKLAEVVGGDSPIRVLGGRGKWQFAASKDGDKSLLRLQPLSASPDDERVMMLGCDIEQLVGAANLNPEQHMLVSFEARIVGDAGGKCEIFIQDHLDSSEKKYTRRSSPIEGNEWKVYLLGMNLRPNADEFLTGVYWEPTSADTTLEIRDFKLLVLE